MDRRAYNPFGFQQLLTSIPHHPARSMIFNNQKGMTGSLKNSMMFQTPNRMVPEKPMPNTKPGRLVNPSVYFDQKQDRKLEFIRKLLDSHKTLTKDLQFVTEERDHANWRANELEADNQKLKQNYEKILKYIQQVPTHSLDQELKQAQRMCVMVLKTVSRKNSGVSERVDSPTRRLQLPLLTNLNQIRKRSFSIQTEEMVQSTSDREQRSQEQANEASKIIQALEIQNSQLRQKLKRSEELRTAKMSNLKNIVSRTNCLKGDV